jgi:hypothetical protein
MPGVGCGGTPILAMDVWEHALSIKTEDQITSKLFSVLLTGQKWLEDSLEKNRDQPPRNKQNRL